MTSRKLAARQTPTGRIVRFLLVLLLGALSSAAPAAGQPTAFSRLDLALTGPGASTRAIDPSALFHTLSADFFSEDDRTVYVQTGDIPAMWLRDSSAQSLPYVRFAPFAPNVADRIRGVIERNAKNVLTDSYANAFTAGFKVWEEKWEPDSLAYPITLACSYYTRTGDRRIFTQRLHWAFEHTLLTYACEQRHATCSHYTSRFLTNDGRGADFGMTGMIWAAFRPSDEPVRFPFNIPQQMLAAVALDEMAELLETGYGDQENAEAARVMAARIREGIERFGRIYTRPHGWIYAYEVDGLGGTKLMDDANLPSLLSAPLFGYLSVDDPIYQNTRRYAWSPSNLYFYRGKYAEGIGSSHTPTGWVWPLSIIAYALTATDPSEVRSAIVELAATDGSGGLTHESFDPDDPNRFSRAEFGWANAMYAELVFRSLAGLQEDDGDSLDPDPLPTIFRADDRTPALVPRIEQWRNGILIYRALQTLSQP